MSCPETSATGENPQCAVVKPHVVIVSPKQAAVPPLQAIYWSLWCVKDLQTKTKRQCNIHLESTVNMRAVTLCFWACRPHTRRVVIVMLLQSLLQSEVKVTWLSECLTLRWPCHKKKCRSALYIYKRSKKASRDFFFLFPLFSSGRVLVREMKMKSSSEITHKLNDDKKKGVPVFTGLWIYKVTLFLRATGIHVAAATVLSNSRLSTSSREIHTRTAPAGLFAAPHATLVPTSHSPLCSAVAPVLVFTPLTTWLTFPLQSSQDCTVAPRLPSSLAEHHLYLGKTLHPHSF